MMFFEIGNRTWEALELTPNVWCANCNLVWWPEELRQIDTCKCGDRTYDWNEICELIEKDKVRIVKELSSTGLMYK